MTIEAPTPPVGTGDLSLDDTLLELLPVAVYVCGADGMILRYNRRAAELWGRAPAIGDTEQRFCGAHRLYWPDGRPLPHAETPMAAALSHGVSTRDQEVCIERPDGVRIIASVNIDPLRNADGQIVGAVNCFQDISERKRIEEELKRQDERLRESERVLRELLEALPTAVYTTDAEGRLTFYNEAAAEFWGFRPELGTARWCGSWRLYTVDGQPLAHEDCPMAVALREQRPIRNQEAVAERPNGTRVPFMPFPTPLFDAEGRLKGGVNMLVDISFQKRAQAQQALLIHELNHRVKNTLATVQSIAHQTLRRAADAESFRDTFTRRLLALSRAHDLLTAEGWTGADLRALLGTVLTPYDGQGAGRAELDGPPTPLPPRVALGLAMAAHELATNAAKYGALASPAGRLAVTWSHAEDGALRLSWDEAGGPPVSGPDHAGFGLRMIERTLKSELGGALELAFEPAGLRCRMTIPMDRSG